VGDLIVGGRRRRRDASLFELTELWGGKVGSRHRRDNTVRHSSKIERRSQKATPRGELGELKREEGMVCSTLLDFASTTRGANRKEEKREKKRLSRKRQSGHQQQRNKPESRRREDFCHRQVSTYVYKDKGQKERSSTQDLNPVQNIMGRKC